MSRLQGECKEDLLKECKEVINLKSAAVLESYLRFDFISSTDRNRQLMILDTAIELASQNAIDGSYPLIILEDLCDISQEVELPFVFERLCSTLNASNETLSSSRGKGLIVLRICNNMLKRVSKTQSSSLCGKILLLMSKTFPSSERSGLNLRGDPNLDNITIIDELTDASSFYSRFWKMQHYILRPAITMSSIESWQQMLKTVDETLVYFTQKPASNNIQQSDWPKFLSDVNLFELQLTDATFREIIVTEFIIFVQSILALHEDATKPNNKLSRDQEEGLQHLQTKLADYLKTYNKSNLGKILRKLSNLDRVWQNWKASGCPPFEKMPIHLKVENEDVDLANLSIPSLSNTITMGSEELARLWSSSSSDPDSARPEYSQFIQQLVDQLKEEDADPDLFYSRDDVFRWRLMRLIFGEHSQLDFSKCHDPQYIENIISSSS